MQCERLAQFEEEIPTPELAAKHGAELVDIRDLDVRGRAVRVGATFKPATMYAQGRITKRQLGAAMKMEELHHAARFGAIAGVRWGERVQGGVPRADGHAGRLDAKREYMGALDALPRPMRTFVERVCTQGALPKDAMVDIDAMRAPAGASERSAVGMAMLTLALETLADHFGM